MVMENTNENIIEHFSRADRDLLVTMHEQIKGIKSDIKDLKDGTSAKLNDHENRIRSIEQFKWQLIGGLLVLQAVEGILLYLILKK